MVQSLIKLPLALALLAGALVSLGRVDAETVTTSPWFAIHHSEQFGFVVWWIPALWTVSSEVTEDGYEFVRLENPAGAVFFEAYAQPGITRSGCLDNVLAGFLADDAVSEITFDRNDTFSYTYEHEDGSVSRLKQKNRCEIIRDGQVAFRAGSVIDAGLGSNSTGLIQDQLDQVAFLRGSWPTLPVSFPSPTWAEATPVLGQFEFDLGTEDFSTAPVPFQFVGRVDQGTVESAKLLVLPAGSHYASLEVRLTNPTSAKHSIMFGDDRFFLQDMFGFVHEPVHSIWQDGPVDPSVRHAELAPGESARLQIFFALAKGVHISVAECRCRRFYEPGSWTPGSSHQTIGPWLEAEPWFGGFSADYSRVRDREGQEYALMSRLWRFDGNGFSTLRILIENTGSKTLRIDPDRFLTDPDRDGHIEAGEALPLNSLRSHEWLHGTERTNGVQRIEPGAIAVIEVEIEPEHSLYYLAEQDHPIPID